MELQLKALRKKAGLNQKQMAEKLGIKTRSYGGWERGEIKFMLNDAIRIADILDCTLDEIAGYTPTNQASTPIDLSPATNAACQTIAQLHHLRQKGAITEEQYQEKKNAQLKLM